MKKFKLFSLLTVFVSVIIILTTLVIITCSNNNLLQSDEGDGTTKFQVRIHDEPFKSSHRLLRILALADTNSSLNVG